MPHAVRQLRRGRFQYREYIVVHKDGLFSVYRGRFEMSPAPYKRGEASSLEAACDLIDGLPRQEEWQCTCCSLKGGSHKWSCHNFALEDIFGR